MKSVLTIGFEKTPNENIVDFFNPTMTPYRDMLANPETTRYAGWDLVTYDQPRICNADYYEVTNGDRKIVRLYQDGSLIAKANLDSSFLGHASEKYSKEGELLINPIALCEFVYNFVSFSLRIINTMNVEESKLDYRFKMVNLIGEDVKYILSPVASNMFYGQDAQPASRNVIEGEYKVTYTEENRAQLKNEVAYELVKRIFLNFGFEETMVPLFDPVTKVFQIEKVQKM